MSDERSWIPSYKCPWCGSAYVQKHVDYMLAWCCPTERCYNRQIKWKIVDDGRKLFYLPMPRLVEVEEAVASLQYGAICLGGDRSGGKSVGLRSLIYRYCRKIPNFSALLLRRNFPELSLNHMRFAAMEAPRLGATWSEAKKLITFHDTGATLQFGHCWKPRDYAAYIGGDVDLIMFGQLEEYALFAVHLVFAVCVGQYGKHMPVQPEGRLDNMRHEWCAAILGDEAQLLAGFALVVG